MKWKKDCIYVGLLVYILLGFTFLDLSTEKFFFFFEKFERQSIIPKQQAPLVS